MGIPGWPEFALCTASIASARIALHMSRSSAADETAEEASSFIGLSPEAVSGEHPFYPGQVFHFPPFCSTIGPEISVRTKHGK
jgi:hypothetical protein